MGFSLRTHRSTGSSLYMQSAAASRQVEQGWFPSHRRFRCLQKSQARRAPGYLLVRTDYLTTVCWRGEMEESLTLPRVVHRVTG